MLGSKIAGVLRSSSWHKYSWTFFVCGKMFFATIHVFFEPLRLGQGAASVCVSVEPQSLQRALDLKV